MMRIEALELRHLCMPLVHPFETSFGRYSKRDTVIVKAWSEGLVGFGEAATTRDPFYSPETIDTCWHIQRDFIAPLVLNWEIETPMDLVARLSPIRGHNMAKAAVQLAFWDLFAQRQGLPLAKALGGTRSRIAAGVSIGIEESVKALLETIGASLQEGYQRIKLKIKPGWDVQVVEAVRRNFPSIPLMVDANSAYTLEDMAILKRLDVYNLMMIEQPLSYDDIVDHAILQAQICTPICLDESIHSPEDARKALDLGSCRVINIKVGRVGGLCQAKLIHDLCLSRGIAVWCGSRIESGIGTMHNIAISSLPGFTLPGDISGSSRLFPQDVIEPPVTVTSEGTMVVPTIPGLGVEVLDEVLESYTVRKELLRQ